MQHTLARSGSRPVQHPLVENIVYDIYEQGHISFGDIAEIESTIMNDRHWCKLSLLLLQFIVRENMALHGHVQSAAGTKLFFNSSNLCVSLMEAPMCKPV